MSRALLPLALVLAAACAPEVITGPPETARDRPDPSAAVEEVLARWCRPSALAARALIERYGPPDTVDWDEMTWDGGGPWKRITVRDRPADSPTTAAPPDLVVQTIDYRLTPELAARFVAFSADLRVDLERGELSSCSDREEVNFLNLNLADDIARGRRTVAEARRDFGRLLSQKSPGRTSPYTAGLLFSF